MEIEKENQKLLKKLVEISAGKKPSQNIPPKNLSKSNSVNSIEFRTKSLHFNSRKAELERIERENQKIAKKIFCLKSDLAHGNFVKDFQHHEEIRKNLARIRKKKVPVFAGKPGYLPPISGERQGSAPNG